jgi:deazaflavin-dependent oxidoreductase (nitroreductase family)
MNSALRHVDASKPPGILRRGFSSVATTRPLLFFSRHVSWKLDPFLLGATCGRVSTTGLIRTGVLETRGARTQELRRHAVIYWRDGEAAIIAASNAGRPENPSWYYNLRSNPEVTFAGVAMRATVVEEDGERSRLWSLGDRVFPAFATYRTRSAAAGRTIPLIRLTPSDRATPWRVR